MNVSIWTDGLALLGDDRFNQRMRRWLPLVFASLGLVALFVWMASLVTSGPEMTGPDDAQVLVSDVPDPYRDPASTSGQPSDSEADVWALPEGFRQLLDRDAIAPIYDPTFTTADESTWPDNALVVGVEINGDARAYPVGPLNRREMVLDTIGGIPVLVSW